MSPVHAAGAGVKLSVILTTFNHERWVAQAVESVLAQRTRCRYELLLADDRSTDGTLAILQRYERAQPDVVRVVVAERNRGDLGKRFFCEVLRLCRGDYVALLDGDDFWTSPDKLQTKADFLDAHPDCTMCFHDVRRVDETGEVELGRVNPGPGILEPTLHDLLPACFVASCSPMFRMRVLADLPAWYHEMPWGDWPLYLIAAQHGRIAYQDVLMGAYRVHPGGVWSGLDPVRQNTALIGFYRALEPILGPRYLPRLRQCRSLWYRRLARVHLERRQWTQAIRCAFLAFAAGLSSRLPRSRITARHAAVGETAAS